MARVDPAEFGPTIDQPDLTYHIQQFLYQQQASDSESHSSASISSLPEFYDRIAIFPSTVATFYAPSDISGIGGMRSERIRAVDSWRDGPARRDCVFVNTDATAKGFRGLDVARVRLFFSFTEDGISFPCALVQWFSRVGDEPDEDTGMWVVKPDIVDGTHNTSVIHLDSIVRAAHLLGVCANGPVPRHLDYSQTLDVFQSFYVNKYIDHHAFEIAF